MGKIFFVSETQLAWRRKQISLVKNTKEYKALAKDYPSPSQRAKTVPQLSIHVDCSKRSFQQQIVLWRKDLHRYYSILDLIE